MDYQPTANHCEFVGTDSAHSNRGLSRKLLDGNCEVGMYAPQIFNSRLSSLLKHRVTSLAILDRVTLFKSFIIITRYFFHSTVAISEFAFLCKCNWESISKVTITFRNSFIKFSHRLITTTGLFFEIKPAYRKPHLTRIPSHSFRKRRRQVVSSSTYICASRIFTHVFKSVTALSLVWAASLSFNTGL